LINEEGYMAVYELEQMTSPELRRLIDEGVTRVVVPIGSIEQHGKHMPLGTDAMLGDEIGRRAAERLGAVLAPTVRVGCAEHHMGFTGTMTLSRDTLRDVAIEMAESLARHGFRLIVLLPTHGGNFASVAAAVEELNSRLDGATAYSPAADFARDVIQGAAGSVSSKSGITPGQSGAHSGEWETSIMLHLRPTLVAMDAAEIGYTGDMAEGIRRMYEQREGVESLSPNGVMGDPTLADVRRGEAYLERFVSGVVDSVERFHQPA
jgi:creatinine amidohydrolase